jgi:hypothetical protein
MMDYLRNYKENTGVALSPEKFSEEGSQFTPQASVRSCPRAPIAFVVAGFDDGNEPMKTNTTGILDNVPRWLGGRPFHLRTMLVELRMRCCQDPCKAYILRSQ